MANKVKSPQFNLRINGVLYKNCFMKQFIYSLSVLASDTDYTNKDTGVAKFPNNLLAYSMMPGWVSANWNETYKAGNVTQGTTNLMVNAHVSSSVAQTMDLHIWAIGN